MSWMPPSEFFTSYVQTQIVPRDPGEVPRMKVVLPSLTISRQAGAKGNTVANLLVERLSQTRPAGTPPWMLFNENLMREVLRAHRLPPEWERFFPEARPSEWREAIETLLLPRPDSWTVFEYTCARIEHLLRTGHCVIVGRAAHLVGREFPGVLHLRLIGSVEKRLEHMLGKRLGDRRATLAELESKDRGRRAYARQYFNRDIDSPHDYALVCNTDHLSPEIIADGVARLIKESSAEIPHGGQGSSDVTGGYRCNVDTSSVSRQRGSAS